MSTRTITQAMINAYDEYTHLTLDRRGFMEKLTKLAGSGAAAAAIAPLLAANSAHAAIVAEDDARLKARGHHLSRLDGRDEGLSRASGRPERQAADGDRHPRESRPQPAYPGRGAARGAGRLRGAGARLPVAARRHAGRRGEGARDVRASSIRRRQSPTSVATVAFLKTHELGNGKVGAVGFCWGGGAVNDLAVGLARPRRRRRLLRPPAEGRGCRQDQGAAAAPLCRAGRAHQCRHRSLQGGACRGRQGVPDLRL